MRLAAKMKTFWSRTATTIIALGLVGAGSVAHAESVSFKMLTTNDKSGPPPYNYDSNTQYRTVVSSVGTTGVSFTFYNEGAIQSSITDVYFDDYDSDAVLKFSSTIPKSPTVTGSAGVAFTVDADSKVSPANLPGANLADPDFVVTSGMSADADNPVYAKGVNNWTGSSGLGEWVTMTFVLNSGKTFADVIDALQLSVNPDAPPQLRIGIKVQGFADGGSESFLSNPLPQAPPPITVVPLPAAVWGGMALFGVMGTRHTLKRRRATSHL
jgi:hypothetical protein